MDGFRFHASEPKPALKTLVATRCRATMALGWYPELLVPPANAPGLHSRCMLDRDHAPVVHESKGLAQFDYQRWKWLEGDRRSYDSDRDDEYAWEQL